MSEACARCDKPETDPVHTRPSVGFVNGGEGHHYAAHRPPPPAPQKPEVTGLSDLAKMLLARAGGRIIPQGHYGFTRGIVWVDINKLAQATADMDMWASNRLGVIWGDDRKDAPAYPWHRGINGPPLCGAEMEANPLTRRAPLVEHQCEECKRIWHELNWTTG